MTPIPLLNLQEQYQALQPELEIALLRVARSQHCVLGPEVEQLESTLAEYCGARYALGVSSGTDALLMALMAVNIQPGDEVLVPTFSFFATAGAVARLGARPVFVDSLPGTMCMDVAHARGLITPRTKGIIPVHLYGQAMPMDEILQLSKAHGLLIIEDAAQAIGAGLMLGGKPVRVGGVGHIGCFSFYPTKNLGALGDAGLVTTNDEHLYKTLIKLRNHGMEPRYYHSMIGGNFRMDALQAAALNVKFPYLDGWHIARQRHAERYSALLKESGITSEQSQVHQVQHHIQEFKQGTSIFLPELIWKQTTASQHHIFHQYTICTPRRDELRKYLAERGIATEVYYPVPFHRQECFAYLQANNADYPVANFLADHVLSLPVYPELSVEEIERVVGTIVDFFHHSPHNQS